MLGLCATGTDLTIDEWNAWEPAEASQAHRPLRRVIKTHAPAQLAPWIGGVERGLRDGARVIVVTRNPKDACVSMFHHSRDVPAFGYPAGTRAPLQGHPHRPGQQLLKGHA